MVSCNPAFRGKKNLFLCIWEGFCIWVYTKGYIFGWFCSECLTSMSPRGATPHTGHTTKHGYFYGILHWAMVCHWSVSPLDLLSSNPNPFFPFLRHFSFTLHYLAFSCVKAASCWSCLLLWDATICKEMQQFDLFLRSTGWGQWTFGTGFWVFVTNFPSHLQWHAVPPPLPFQMFPGWGGSWPSHLLSVVNHGMVLATFKKSSLWKTCKWVRLLARGHIGVTVMQLSVHSCWFCWH